MKVIDLHCDVLWKLWEGSGNIRFQNDRRLDVNVERLKKGEVKVQCFAIFVPPEVKSEDRFRVALEQVNYFYSEVLANHQEMIHIRDWSEVSALGADEIGAVLTLEGVDCIGADIQKLQLLHHMGVLSVGLTWNEANLAADGVQEPRGAGLTSFGKEIVNFHNERRIFTDVSHLSEAAFWDVMEIAHFPIASHSNAKAVCGHRRNLSDRQAQALFSKGAMIHVVFYPEFIHNKEVATIDDLIRHIEHFCSLGGVKQIGFGSDFDGIDKHTAGLEHAGRYQNLIEKLMNYYSEDQVKGFAHGNFMESLPLKS